MNHPASNLVCFSPFSCILPQKRLDFVGSTDSSLSAMSGFFSSEAEMALTAEEQEAQYLFYQTMAEEEQNRRLAQQGTIVSSVEASSSVPAYSSRQQLPGQLRSSEMPIYPVRRESNPMAPSPYQPIVPSSPYLTAPSGSTWQTLTPYKHGGSSRGASSASRSPSPNPSELHNFGYPAPDGKSWRCAHPGCTSQATFTRGCDLRKHFRRHTKSLFCRHESCSQSQGFSSKKDRDRHEASHQPGVACEWRGCERIFSRVDNMKDHVRRIHQKPSR